MVEGERFNSISHLVGAVAAISGTTFLIANAVNQADPWKVIGSTVYGTTLVCLYVCSTLYHSMASPQKALFRRLDHLAIYLLIAGTYTPFTLVTLRGAWGWSIFGIVWGLAMLGILLELSMREGRRIFPIVIYLIMGWLVVVASGPLLRALSPSGVIWLVLGGLFYTSGLLFYGFDKKVIYFHGIWHLFVIAGSMSHFISIYQCVV